MNLKAMMEKKSWRDGSEVDNGGKEGIGEKGGEMEEYHERRD